MRLILILVSAIAAFGLYAPPQPLAASLPSGAGAALGCITAVGSIAAGASPLVAMAVGLISVAGAEAIKVARTRRAGAEARDRWPDFLAVVRGRIGSGDSLPEAVRAAALALDGPFRQLDRAWGGSFASELDRARNTWRDPVADRVLVTLGVAAATGGSHVDAVLSSLATSISEEIQIRAAHQAAITQQRLTAGVALVAPWVILFLSLGTNPQAGASFETPTGRSILLGGGIATVGGYLLARRASSLAAPPRVFE